MIDEFEIVDMSKTDPARSEDGLSSFLTPVRAWFEESFGQPTPPQAQGWPAIQRGEHTLILAPTGSGKTLAAFLWGIDQLFRELTAEATCIGTMPVATTNREATQVATTNQEATQVATTNREATQVAATDQEATQVAATNREATQVAATDQEATQVAATDQEATQVATTNEATQVATTDRAARVAAADQVAGVRLVYISPLKALNNDIHRNLRLPLAGIRHKAHELGLDFPPIRVAVRSGDTPQRERQAMLRQPPHILITTPESFYLLLTSPKARDMFRTVRTVIVDEVHTLAGNKRGVHLSLSLERLQHLAGQPVQRLGLSATIQPLDEVARFLGGSEWQGERGKGEKEKATRGCTGKGESLLQPRPVTVINAAYEKALDLQVVTVMEDFRNLPGDSIWPSIIPRVLALIRQHRTTLIFANNRRLAERTADRLNEQIAAEAAGRNAGLIEGGVARGIGMMAAGDGTHSGPIRVHHGSVSKEARLELEHKLKAGELPALVGTSSLELGIDIGVIDLVVQLQSPKSVAQGLQRVGRSGHLVGQTSVGRIFPTHREDVVEAAAIAGGMLRGEVEPTYTPRQPLDVLAQQIVAMVSVETWDVQALFDLVRCAYAYNDLTWRAFETTLGMLAGRYPSEAYRELRARLAWDRVNNKLAALPGSRLLALTNGGTIPDTGAFGAYLSDGKTKLGELDEEFVFETRIGDTFMLGSQVWRVIGLTDDRVVVAEAPGSIPRMPFWRGDYPWRPYELGVQVGAFRRTVAERLEQVRRELDLQDFGEIRRRRESTAVQAVLAWLGEDYALDALSAWNVVHYLAGQLDHAGAVACDRTILVEVFEDALGDGRLVIHSPFGGRVNGPWGLALAGALRERTGTRVEVQTNDDGILFRLLHAEAEFPLDLVTGMGPAEARERILRELPHSAVFGARFRQNAARALLLPGVRGGKRTPFWLQRLRARDLLQVVRRFGDFPIVAETYRDCLQDVLDLPHLEQVLTDIQQGAIQVIVLESETPSPVAQSLLWDFVNVHMYEWDAPRAEQQLQMLAVNRDLLQDLLKDVALDELLRPEAIEAIRGQLQHTIPTAWARTAEELAVVLQQMGDLSAGEIALRTMVDPSDWVARLAGENRIVELAIPTARGPERRWVAAEYQPEYVAAFGPDIVAAAVPERVERRHPDGPPAERPGPERGGTTPGDGDEARRRILQRFLGQAGPVTLEAIRARYAFDEEWLQAELDRLIEARQLVHGHFTPQPEQAEPGRGPERFVYAAPAESAIRRSEGFAPSTVAEFIDRRTLEQIHRRTLHILRQEVQPVPFTVYADFLARWQHVHPEEKLAGEGALVQVLQQLRAAPVVGRIWERDVLPLRLARYQPAELDALCQGGEVVWIGSGGANPRRGRVRFLFRGEGNLYLEPAAEDWAAFDDQAQTVYGFLKSEGAVFFADICSALELDAAAVEAALIELVMAGLVTNDSLEAMRRIVEQGAPQPRKRKPFSSLEEELARRRERLGHANVFAANVSARTSQMRRRSGRAKYRTARRRVLGRARSLAPTEGFEQRAGRVGGPADAKPPQPRWVGRWTLVHRFGVLGKAVPLAERVARQTRQLLARYGMVTHECLADEFGSWDWGLIFQHLQQLEMRGEVRRGYFVQGLSGVQFALPEVVERLRAIRDGVQEEPGLVVMNACDPANLYGPARDDGPQTAAPQTAAGEPLAFARVPSTWLVQSRGLPVLIAVDSGTSLTVTPGMDEGLVQRALQALLDHLARFAYRVTVETWNGEPVLESAGRPLLEAVGFHRYYPAMVWVRRPSGGGR